AGEIGGECHAVVVGGEEGLSQELCQTLGSYGAKKVFRADGPEGLAQPVVDVMAKVIDDGDYGYHRVNVDAQRDDDQSLLAWFERMLRALRECPESGDGEWSLLDAGLEHVLAVRFDGSSGTTLAVTNLRDEPCTIDLSADVGAVSRVLEVFADQRYETRPDDLTALDLGGWGYRWLRVE
ncbi:MAG: maltose alpha-D-glucosyltransferase / alpha-amylase, partial [Actinomycetota bacterium]